MKASKSGGCSVLIGVLVIIWLIVSVTSKCNRKKDYENSSWYIEWQVEKQRQEDSIKHLNELAQSNPEEYNRIMQEHEAQLRQEKMWKFTTEKDEKTNTDNVWATIQSYNEGVVIMPEPLKRKKNFSSTKHVGKSKITIRYMKKYGSEVLVKIPDLPSFKDPSKNYISVWFDSMDNPVKYSYEGSTTKGNVFIKNGKDYINRCKKSTRIKMRIPFENYRHENDAVDFVFEVPEPLVWKH